jgi:ribonuclease HI
MAPRKISVRKDAKFARRLDRAKEQQQCFPYWTEAFFRKTTEVWICCNQHGEVPRRRLIMRYSATSKEYSPNRKNITFPKDGMPHSLSDEGFVPYQTRFPGTTLAKPLRPSRSEPCRLEHAKEIIVYTDGSERHETNQAGCAAVIWKDGVHTEISRPLPPCRALEAELHGVLLGLTSLQDRTRPVLIVTDCQDVERILSRPVPPKSSGQTGSILKTLASSFPRVRVMKVKGHAGITGNELAHNLAYKAMLNSKKPASKTT